MLLPNLTSFHSPPGLFRCSLKISNHQLINATRPRFCLNSDQIYSSVSQPTKPSNEQNRNKTAEQRLGKLRFSSIRLLCCVFFLSRTSCSLFGSPFLVRLLFFSSDFISNPSSFFFLSFPALLVFFPPLLFLPPSSSCVL